MTRIALALFLTLGLAACAATGATSHRASSGTTDAGTGGLGDQDPRAEAIYQRLKGSPEERGPRR